MSIEAYRAAWANSNEINSGAFLVLLSLADHANDCGHCWPSIARIATMTKLSERQVKRHLQALADQNIITIDYGDGRGNTSKYTILGTRKGDIHDQKGDADDTLLDQERVTSEAERVTSMTVKGDAHVTRSIKNHNNHQIYIAPDPEPIAAIKTALTTITKTPLWAKTEEDYDQAAYLILGYEASPDDIKAFGKWWITNGHYKGKPALASLLQEFPNYLQARKPVYPPVNGHHQADNFADLVQKMEITDVIKR